MTRDTRYGPGWEKEVDFTKHPWNKAAFTMTDEEDPLNQIESPSQSFHSPSSPTSHERFQKYWEAQQEEVKNEKFKELATSKQEPSRRKRDAKYQEKHVKFALPPVIIPPVVVPPFTTMQEQLSEVQDQLAEMKILMRNTFGLLKIAAPILERDMKTLSQQVNTVQAQNADTFTSLNKCLGVVAGNTEKLNDKYHQLKTQQLTHFKQIEQQQVRTDGLLQGTALGVHTLISLGLSHNERLFQLQQTTGQLVVNTDEVLNRANESMSTFSNANDQVDSLFGSIRGRVSKK